MRSLTSATMVCRVLVGLDRANASGVLHLHGDGRHAALALESGSIVGANVDRHVTSSERQLLRCATRICEWDGLRLRLAPEPSATTWWRLREPVPARSLGLRLMQHAVQPFEPATIRGDLGDRVYHLTDAGDAVVRGAVLRPEESVALFRLRRGVVAAELFDLPQCGLRGYRFAWALKLLGGAGRRAGGSYPLLLRKRREVRRQVPPRVLLDLPETADGPEARRALRRLVRDLHPDRFDEGAPVLQRASGEIVSALVHAEASIADKSTK